MPEFRVNPAYRPVADQPEALAQLAEGIDSGDRFQTLLGVTGSGKTATMAFTIEQVQRPALVIAHNKTLAAQLCNEFREFFPDNAVEYFVSYYDYYQPEAYVPAQDLYIEKDSSINEEIDRLRHAATSALFARRDVIVVAQRLLHLRPRLAAEVQLAGHAADEGRDGRSRRDPAQARRQHVHAQRRHARARLLPRAGRDARGLPGLRGVGLPGGLLRGRDRADPALRPAHRRGLPGARARRHLAGHALRDRPETLEGTIGQIRDELEARCKELEEQGKLLESHRLRQRTQFDMEMLRELGYCNGIENYSRIPRRPCSPASGPSACSTSSRTTSSASSTSRTRRSRRSAACTRATARASRRSSSTASGCRARSTTGRRPSTSTSSTRRRSSSCRPRPATSSATTQAGSSSRSSARPGVVDPEVDVRETKNQIDDLMEEIRQARRGGGTDARHDADQEDGRGPDRLPARVRLPGPLPALRDRHARAHPDHPRAAARRVRRPGRRQPAARGPRSARGLAGGDPRRGQGGLPPRRDVADPDDRPRRPQHPRQGDHVRRQGDGGDAHTRSRRRTAAAPSRSPTTRSTASRRRRSRRASRTSATS